ncbi:uncharacterized protein LOC100217222 [Zea mays]|jgi:hypothetical protein|uniref:Uncharacterized protein n=1 Tax=Zea mays TaxID=4577 RepID=B4FM20_MAIZE|nr:uncharacterized protein LOC100217222 [Zea mays]ACF83163.1 unknown [Zea mays]|eukprot:NP_001137050.1 uncharacterized protein LOC100217222 [Zea mays]
MCDLFSSPVLPLLLPWPPRPLLLPAGRGPSHGVLEPQLGLLPSAIPSLSVHAPLAPARISLQLTDPLPCRGGRPLLLGFSGARDLPAKSLHRWSPRRVRWSPCVLGRGAPYSRSRLVRALQAPFGVVPCSAFTASASSFVCGRASAPSRHPALVLEKNPKRIGMPSSASNGSCGADKSTSSFVSSSGLQLVFMPKTNNPRRLGVKGNKSVRCRRILDVDGEEVRFDAALTMCSVKC